MDKQGNEAERREGRMSFCRFRETSRLQRAVFRATTDWISHSESRRVRTRFQDHSPAPRRETLQGLFSTSF